VQLVAYKGGKCERCGYDKIEYPRAFAFHHVNPEEKDFGISAKVTTFEACKNEADKCMLLCHRCHAEIHQEIDFVSLHKKQADSRKIMKLRLLEYKGNKCEQCGYDKIEYHTAFDFHHKDPSEKDFALSKAFRSFDRNKKEVDKCMLMCKTCHMEIHQKITGINTLPLKLNYSNPKPVIEPKTIQCQQCKEKLTAKFEHQQFCSTNCSSINQRKCERPSKESLLAMLKEKTSTKIAEEHGVSETTIRKWCKKYGIDSSNRRLREQSKTI
jgi:hypothetical protein